MNKLSITKDVIDEWDPQKFLKLGCPDDEYEVEIQGIVEVLEIVNGPKELAIEINRIFNKAFDTDFKKEKDCFVVAKKILSLLS